MDNKTYEQLKKDIPANCPNCAERHRALDVVFGIGKPQRMGPSPSAAAALARTTTKRPAPPRGDLPSTITTTVSQPKPEKDPLIGEPCGIKDCSVKLRSKANTCAVCSKRVCSKHWDRLADCCTACALVAR